MFITTSTKTKSYLNSAIIQKIQYNNSKKLVVGEIKDKTCSISIKHL